MKKLLIFIPFLFLAIACEKDAYSDFVYLEKVESEVSLSKGDYLRRIKVDPNSLVSKAMPNKHLKVVKLLYKTKDPAGNEITASGTVTFSSTLKEGSMKGAILAPHFTIGSDAEAPSVRMAVHEGIFALFDYVVVSPDYVGFGATKSYVHPYHHVENTGRSSVDFLMAAKEYFASHNRRFPRGLRIMGYSEGGHSALSCLRYIEENYEGWFQIKETFAGAGCQDLTATYNHFLKCDSTSLAPSVPLLLLGLDYAEQLHMDFGKIFREPLRSHYDEWINSKQYTMEQLNDSIGTRKLSKILDTALLAKQTNFIAALEKNSHVRQTWKPRSRVWLLHGTADTTVPTLNSEIAYKDFHSAGCDVSLTYFPGKNHRPGAIDFYTFCLLKLVAGISKTEGGNPSETRELVELLENGHSLQEL